MGSFFRTLFVLLLAAWQLNAQTPAYLHYGVRDGLPSNLIYCGLQDKDGLLWFATDKGLARFDGSRFRVYDMSDGLPDSEVFNLKTDSRGRLWMFCYQKKPCYRYKGRIVTGASDPLLANIDFETALGELTEDERGVIWISSFSNRYYRLTDTSVVPIRGVKGINKTCCFYDGVIGATGNTAEYYFIRTDGSVLNHTNDPELAQAAKYISVESQGKYMLWSTENGLFLAEYLGDGRLRVVDRQPEPAGRIYLDRSGRFWVCSLAGGAVCFDNYRYDLSNPVVYLPEKKITTFFEDAQGTFWFSTAGEGVFALPRNSPVIYNGWEGLTGANITAVSRDYQGAILAGNDEGKLFRLAADKQITHVDYSSKDGYNRVRQILPQPDGSRWVATDEELYFEAPDPNGIYPKRFSSPFKLGHPKEILVREGHVMLASSARLYDILGVFEDSASLKPYRKTTIAADAEGYAWVGGIDEFFSEKDGFQTNWSEHFPLLKNRIIAIAPSTKGYLWIVTPEAGLLRASTDRGTIIDVERVSDRLKNPIRNIQHLYSEPGGRLWMATNKGIYGLDSSWHVIHFDTHDGLADDDVNAVYVHKDTLWAATANGLCRLILRQSDARGNFPTLVTALRYRNDDRVVLVDLLDSIPPGNKITLPAHASLVQLELAGLDFRGRGNLFYRCRQTPVPPPMAYWTFDHLITWIFQGFGPNTNTTVVEEPLLSFGVHLPPGAYRLQITAINPSGIVSEYPADITLVMQPYWYQSLWLALLFWAAIGYGIRRIYKARIAYRDLTASVSTLQLQALQAQINPHFVGNSINAIQQFFYPPDPLRASEFISIFTDLLRRTLLFSEKHFIPFQEELAYDRDYLKLIELRFGDRFEYTISGVENVRPDTPFPSMLLQILLENATLHGLAPEGVSRLKLDFSWSGKHLLCTISDNGVGYEASKAHKKSTGAPERKSKGLEMLGKKIETLNRLYDIDLGIQLRDLSHNPDGPDKQGTRVVISYIPSNAPAAALAGAKSERSPAPVQLT